LSRWRGERDGDLERIETGNRRPRETDRERERERERERGGAGDGERGETENGRNGSESLVYEP
jgi:hypothetical protein